MNERIKELAEQCWDRRLDGVHFDQEKFANLVAAHEREACRLIVIDNSDAEGICCTDDVLEAFRQREKK